MKAQVYDGGYIPQRGHWLYDGAGFRSCESVTLEPHDGHVFELNVDVQLPRNCFGCMVSNSGLMMNHGIICMGGIIDAGFRGPIKVRMYNTSNERYRVHKGDKIVQMVMIPCQYENSAKVVSLDPLEDSRDFDGWWSTGK